MSVPKPEFVNLYQALDRWRAGTVYDLADTLDDIAEDFANAVGPAGLAEPFNEGYLLGLTTAAALLRDCTPLPDGPSQQVVVEPWEYDLMRMAMEQLEAEAAEERQRLL
jgi:hypothetical protein